MAVNILDKEIVVKSFWSGGKDSTCAVLTHLELGHIVKCVCYIPMFDEDIPLILKEQYNFLYLSAEKLRSFGAEVHFVFGMTYVDYCTHRALSGKNKGLMFGYPCFKTSQCGFKRDSKEKACTLDVGYFDFIDIGIAYDEVSRKKQLNAIKVSILNELKITEVMARKKAERFGLLSPVYTKRKRDGCALCPNASEDEREQWFRDYPLARGRLLQLQNLLKIERPDRFPLRGKKLFL